jgi:hypothetical protein
LRVDVSTILNWFSLIIGSRYCWSSYLRLYSFISWSYCS